MIKVTQAARPQNPTIYNRVKHTCIHGRIVDEVRTAEGAKTGQLICLECLAVFPDPLVPEQVH